MKQTASNYLRMDKKTYRIVDTLSFLSKNMYNVGLYNVRQHFFQTGKYLSYESNYHVSKTNENYSLLHSDNSQQILKMVDRSFRSFFGLLQAKKDGRLPEDMEVRIPHYLDKNGRFLLIFPAARLRFSDSGSKVSLGMSIKFKKQHGLKGDELTFNVPAYISPTAIKEIRIAPVHDGKSYKIEYVYDVMPEEMSLDPNQYLSIDLGLDNFATLVESVDGAATIIDGKHVKSINRYYNKEMARLQRIKDKQGVEKFTRRQSRITIRRGNQINEFLNRAVNYVVNVCLKKHIGNIVVGELKEIKQEINHGKRNNQNFVQIPYWLFKRKLKGKCQRYGIEYHEVDEAYTSRTDALNFDEIREQPYDKTRRIERGLYRSITGVTVNADVNGSLNIMRKVADESIVRRIVGSGLVNRPWRIRLAWETTQQTSPEQNCTQQTVQATAL